MPRSLVGFALVALMAPSAWGAPDSKIKPHETPSARREAGRVLKLVQELVRSSEIGDARPCVKALDHSEWVVRRFAAIRLGAMGLPNARVTELQTTAIPGGRPLPAGHAARKAAQALTTREAEAMPLPEVSTGDAMRAVASVATLWLRETVRLEQPVRRATLTGLLAYRPSLAAKDRGFLARVLSEAIDPAILATELSITQPKQIARKGGRAFLRWLRENEDYLYWHPLARVFFVDVAARSKGEPTDEFRKKHAWGEKEGPFKPLPRPPR